MKFFICERCGNLVGVIHDSGVPMMCCGQKMTALEPNTVEASGEKHLPVVKVEGNTVVAKTTAYANGVSGAATITETVDPSKETNKKPAANPVVASSNAVIKATGDNAAVVFVAAALAVAGVLGMAVRKERAL